MADVTKGQLLEFLIQEAKGRVTREAMDELLEKGPRLGYPRLHRQILAAATQVAAKIPKFESRRGGSYRMISMAYLAAGDLAAATIAAKEAGQSFDGQRTLEAVVQAYAASRDLITALQLIESFPSSGLSFDKDSMLSIIATCQASTGEFMGALRTIERIKYAKTQMEALVKVVKLQAAVDCIGAREAASSIVDWPLRASAFSAIARRTKLAEDASVIRGVAKNLEAGSTVLFEVVLTIACITNLAEDIFEACRLMKEGKYPSDQIACLSTLAPEFERVPGRILRAARDAIKTMGTGWNVHVAIHLAEMTQEEEDFRVALEYVAGIEDPAGRAHRYLDLFEMRKRSEDLAAAREAAMLITREVAMRVRALIRIAEVSGSKDDLNAVREAIGGVKESHLQAEFMADVAAATGSPEDFDTAYGLADKVENDEKRIEALCHIATAVAVAMKG